MRTRSFARPITWVLLGVAVIAVVAAIIYFAQSHTKTGWTLVIVGVLALIGAWFSTAPPRSPE